MRHLHADVLIAIAKGLEVEVRAFEGSDWEPVIPNKTFNPLSNPDWMWRVKPEPEAEWKQKLRQAAREGKRIEFLNCGKWDCSDLNVNPDSPVFGNAKESDYRIVPKTVTRWLWAYKGSRGWYQGAQFFSDEEAEKYLAHEQQFKLEHTKTEFQS